MTTSIHTPALRLLVLPLLAIMTLGPVGCGNKEDRRERDRASAARAGDAARRDSFESSKGDPPIAADTHFAAATYAEESGQLAKAADLYRNALKRDPKHLRAMYRLGVVHAKLQQHGQAIDVWKRYLKATDASAEAYSNLAYAYELAGMAADADATYRKGIQRDPKNVPCRVNYGLMLARRGSVSEAAAQLRAVLDEADVHYNLASVFELQGHKDRAREEYKKALALDPNFRDAQARLAAIE